MLPFFAGPCLFHLFLVVDGHVVPKVVVDLQRHQEGDEKQQVASLRYNTAIRKRFGLYISGVAPNTLYMEDQWLQRTCGRDAVDSSGIHCGGSNIKKNIAESHKQENIYVGLRRSQVWPSGAVHHGYVAAGKIAASCTVLCKVHKCTAIKAQEQASVCDSSVPRACLIWYMDLGIAA